MKPLILSIAVACILVTACKSKSKTASVEAEPNPSVSAAADSTEISNTVISFYDWYATNYNKLMNYDLYDGVKKKDTPPYKINWDVVQKYQAFIRDSIPQLGDAFLVNQRLMFTKADSAFKVDVNDDVPYYFDYDWYTNTQEDPAYMLEELRKTKLWSVKVNGDAAIVSVKGWDENGTKEAATVIDLQMKKENSKWKIAKIGND
jgi:hypothetical protein